MANGDLFKCTFELNVANHPASFEVGFEQTGETGTVADELTALCALAASGDFAGSTAIYADVTTLEAVKCRKLTGAANPTAQVKLENVKGATSGDAIPLIKACLCTHKQQTADVRSNGKSYVPGLPEQFVEVDTVQFPPILAAVQSFFDALLQTNAAIPAGTADFRMVVISYPNGRQQPPVGLPVTSNSVSEILFNSQRRRTTEYGYSEIVV